jgi:hypothetical protein
MRMLRLSSFGIALWLACSSAHAQQEAAIEIDVGSPVEPGTHPDEGIMIAGATVFLVGYLSAALPILAVHLQYCESGESFTCDSTAWGFVPIVHILAGGWDGIIAGSIGLIIETVGLFMFIGGAAHHHPNERAAPRPGDVAITFAPRGADVGLGLELAL